MSLYCVFTSSFSALIYGKLISTEIIQGKKVLLSEPNYKLQYINLTNNNNLDALN